MKIYQVDAFSSKPFAGNPAAVCLLREAKDDIWMQHVAMEMNLSETAFLRKIPEGYHLRWFTPKTEVELCGHATLASAHVLFTEGYLREDEQARFYTKSGWLKAERKGEWLELDFPAKCESSAEPPPALGEVLGVMPLYVGKTEYTYLVELSSEETVRTLNPRFDLMKKAGLDSVIVTSLTQEKDYDFVSRFFAPGVGIDEDPVTGAAHCCLAPFWGRRLSKTRLTGYQASARGGIVKVRVEGERVYLGGQAITVLRGDLLV